MGLKKLFKKTKRISDGSKYQLSEFMITKVESLMILGQTLGLLSEQELGEAMCKLICPACPVRGGINYPNGKFPCPITEIYEKMAKGVSTKDLENDVAQAVKKTGLKMELATETPEFLKFEEDK